MSLATERLVVQLTAEDKRLFTDKARAMNLTLSALVRRAVLDFDASSGSNSLPQLASRLGSQQLSIDSLNDRLNSLEAQLSGQSTAQSLT